MKNKLLFSTLLFVACMLSMNVNAQLEVETSGDVKASKNLNVARNIHAGWDMAIGTSIDNNVALNIYKMCPTSVQTKVYGIKSILKMPVFPIYQLYGAYIEVDAHNSTTLSSYPMPIVGVYGIAKKSSELDIFAAGVVGEAHWRGGVGVYGTINGIPSTLSSGVKYAGLFKGTTKVNGTLYANIYVLNSGDTLRVNNVQSLSRSTYNNITQLRPVSYSFKPDSTWQCDEKLQREMEGTHYGFIAQDVQKVLPELVYEREGELSVNYIEMIPLLLQEIQRLSAEVEELKKQKK